MPPLGHTFLKISRTDPHRALKHLNTDPEEPLKPFNSQVLTKLGKVYGPRKQRALTQPSTLRHTHTRTKP
jgi:hypothetical protein